MSEALSSSSPVLLDLGRTSSFTPDILAALFVQFFHRHFGGHGAQRIDETAFEKVAHRVGPRRLAAQRLRGQRDRLGVGADPDIEFRRDVHPQPVAGDDRTVLRAADLEPVGAHSHADDVVQHRDDEGAAVLHHLLPAHPGAHEGDLFRGPS